MAIELPEFATGAINEVEPTPAEKESGWTLGDAPPSAYFNWLHRLTYQSLKDIIGLLAIQQGNAISHQEVGGQITDNGSPTAVEGRTSLYDNTNGILIVGLVSTIGGTNFTAFSRSLDNGTSFEEQYLHGSGSNDLQRGAISPGNYALVSWGGVTGAYAYAPSPYTTWTFVSSGPFPNNLSGHHPISGYVVSPVAGGSKLAMVSEEDTGADAELLLADAVTPPASGAAFTTVDLSTKARRLRGIATNGVRNVIACHDDTGSTAGVLHALAGEGGVVGEWTFVGLDSSAEAALDIAWNGQVFVALVDKGATIDVYTSADAVTWAQGEVWASGLSRLIADPETSLVIAYRDDAAEMKVARNDCSVFASVINGSDNGMVPGPVANYDRLSYDLIRKRLFGFNPNTINTCRRSL